MSIVIFYEKPGCATNKKQKKMLRKAGCTVIERDLLQHGMRPDELHGFFENRAVPDWFNPNAPKVKTGTVDPHRLTEEEAMRLLSDEPLLIKRPLMIIKGRKFCGFDQLRVQKLLNVVLDTGASSACSSDDEVCSPLEGVVS